jgi:hypothetical protein
VSQYLARALDGLIALFVVVIVGRVIWRRRKAYFRGVWMMAIATFIQMAWYVFNPTTLQIPFWVLFIWAAPMLEEMLRLAGLRQLRSQTPSDWLLFGLGFGLFEAVLKLLVLIVTFSRNPDLPHWVALGTVVPVFLHIGLSALAGLMLRDNRPSVLIFLVTLPLHALNNWRATEIMQQTDVSRVAEMMAVQGVVAATFCAVMVWLSRGVTTEPSHANTPP